MDRMAKSVGAMAILLGSLIAVAAPAKASEVDKLLQAAKREATKGPLFVSITQPNQDKTYQALFEAFNTRFGLNVKYEWQSHHAEYYLRVIAEAQAGRRIPDVMSGSPTNILPLDKAGLLDSFDWITTFGREMPEVRDAVERTIPTLRGKSLAHFDVIYTMVYNTELVSADKVPRTLEDLLNPQWERKLAVNSQASPFTTLGIALGRERVLEIIRKLKANRPVYKRGAPGVVAAVAAGETPLGFGYTSGADVEKSKGAPVEWLPMKDYIPVLQQNMTVLKSGQHPNLARLFAAWMVSDGMEIQEKLEFMGRATARGTRTWKRLNQLSSQAKIVEEKTAEDAALRLSLTKEISKIFAQ